MNATHLHTTVSRKSWMNRLTNFFSLGAFSRTTPALRKPSRAKPSLEALEDRFLMAASLTASLSNGVLQIEGTDSFDFITVAQKDNRLTVGGLSASYDVTQVKSISINALGGNDYVLLWTASGQQPIMAPTAINAGAGLDYVVGGEGQNTIHGG